MARAPKTYYYYYFEARALTLKPLGYYYENGFEARALQARASKSYYYYKIIIGMALRLERFRLEPQSVIIINTLRPKKVEKRPKANHKLTTTMIKKNY